MGCSKTAALVFLLLAFPQSALAVQVHGGGEGFHVHQMAHFFFSAALIFLLYVLHFRPIGQGKAWKFFKISLLFFLAWNLNTILVHWVSLRVPDEYFCGPTLWEQRLGPPITLDVVTYYLGGFDHLLCLPGMYFLMMSLRLFGRDLERRQQCKSFTEKRP